MPNDFTVTDETDLQNAIDAIDVGGTSAAANTNYTITFAPGLTTASPLTLTTPLDAINLSSNDTLTINGAGGALDGDKANRGLFVYSGAVTIKNLTIQNALARGGAGYGGGGGGAGLGGGVFVAAAGKATLIDVGFTDDAAVGGTSFAASGAGVGGGIGLTGNGFGVNGANGFSGANGAGGPGQAGGAGGHGGNGGPASSGNTNNTSGYTGGKGGTGGFAGGGGLGGTGGNEGPVADSGGVGGTGGFGGGGGGGGSGGVTVAINREVGGGGSGGAGGIGGFGGGGGGGGGGGDDDTAAQTDGTPSDVTDGGIGGQGGFGGGTGGTGSRGAVGSGKTGVGHVGQGGGGLGAGGDIFVQQGGSLKIEDGDLGVGAVAGGGGANEGQAYGAGLFLQGTVLVTGAVAGQTVTYSGVIADEVGSGGTKGAGGITITDPGTVVLAAANTYTAGTDLASGTLELASQSATGSGGINFEANAHATLQLDTPALAPGGIFSTQLAGLDSTDTIDLRALTFVPGATATYDPLTDSLRVTSGGVTDTLTNTGTMQNFTAMSDGFGGTEIVVCFAAGTRLRTDHGDIAVEDLAIGDLAITASGAHRPIRWLGHRAIDCRRHPRPEEAMPVRVAAHAFGPDRPAHDLLVSPGHAICVDILGELLVPAGALINGTTITQVAVERVTYWHVELETHDILLAENLPAESYLEMGNRAFFADADIVALGAGPDGPVRRHADVCRPWHADGPIVDALRTSLRRRADALERSQDRVRDAQRRA